MQSPAELRYLREGTAAFIAANPTSLVLIPRTRVKTGTGTSFTDGTPRAAQTVRLIDQSTSRSPQPGLVQTSDGRERLIDYILLMPHDGEVALWDYWTDANGTWEVAQIFPANNYEIRAAVVGHG